MAFIDTHVHFWDRARLPYNWLDDFPAVAGKHLPADLCAEAGDAFPEKIVFVQAAGDARAWLDEVRWIESLAADEPRIAGIVAYAAMDAGAATTAAIDELTRHPLVRGVRHLIQGNADPDFCLRDEFVAGVRQLGARGLTFDLCCVHPQMPSVIELVRRCPDTQFVLDHAGKPGIRAGLLDPWREHLRELAARPNVVGKISGLVTEADWQHWTPATLRPYLEQLWTAFGPARLMFGSDWPMVKLAGTYRGWHQTVADFLAGRPNAELTAVWTENARRIYRLN